MVVWNAITQKGVFCGNNIPQMIENIFIGLLFLGALTYVGNRLRKELSPKKSSCGKGCGCEK